MKTSILIDHEPVADGGFYVRALLRVEGDLAPDDARVPLNLSLVLDRSGSMAGEPVVAAKRAATLLVRRLRMEDTVSVVAYDDDVEVVAPPATGEQQERLPEEIGRIAVGGLTNLSGGWLRGFELAAEHVREGGVDRVLLLTDGHANVGVTEPARLVDMCRSGVQSGVTTTTIGFGPGYDEDLLGAMADAGGGGAYYIERADQAAGVFEEELEGLLSLTAQNLRVRVVPGEDAEFVQVAHRYPSHAEGDALTVEVGDLYAREPRKVLAEFLLRPEAGERGDAEVATLALTAHVLLADGGVELRTVELPIRLSPRAGGRVDPHVRKEVLLLAAAEAREAALTAEREGDHTGAETVVREAISRLEPDAADDPELAEELVDLRLMEQTLADGALAAEDVKYMKQRVYDTHRSRGGSKGRIARGGRGDS